MKPVAFREQNFVYGEGQEEYLLLPVYRGDAPEHRVISCWQLDERDLQELARTGGRIWLQQLTFGGRLQPQLITVETPFEPCPE
jgi:hypothetical protein